MKKLLVAGIALVAIVAGIGIFAAPVLAGGLFRNGAARVNEVSPCCNTSGPIVASCCPGGETTQPAVALIAGSCCDK
jgi:hypothetical protein